MKTVTRMAAQGDLLIRRIDNLPEGCSPADPKDSNLVGPDGNYIVAHSETGHHHVVEPAGARVAFYLGNLEDYTNEEAGDDTGEVGDDTIGPPMLGYLTVEGGAAHVVHRRSFDTHEALELPEGIYEIRRQREWAPDSWRLARD